MEDGYEVLQQHIWLYGRNLVVGLLLHVAVDYLPFLERLEEFVARLSSLQCLIRELARETVQDAPVVGIGSQRVHLLKLQVLTARLLVVDHVVGSGIAEDLRQIVLASNGVPVAIVHLAAGDCRTIFRFEV